MDIDTLVDFQTPGEKAVLKISGMIGKAKAEGKHAIYLINMQYSRSEAAAINNFLKSANYVFEMRHCKNCKDLWDLTINL